jgi:hypothetical protein
MKTKIFLFIAVLLALSLNACQTAVIPEEAPSSVPGQGPIARHSPPLLIDKK